MRGPAERSSAGPLAIRSRSDQALRLGARFFADWRFRTGRLPPGEPRVVARRLRLADRTLDVVHILLELTNPLAERGADLGNALGAEQDQYDDQNDDQLGHTDVAEHGDPPRRAIGR